jgi:hypothetical protein
MDPTENTTPNSSSVVAFVSTVALTWFSHRGNIFTEPLHRNGRILWFCYLAFSRYVTIWFSLC